MSTHDVVLALPTEDRGRAYAFARALGFETPGDLADDGVPEPLRLTLNAHTSVMYVPTGGFGWVTAGRDVAPPGTVGCLVSLTATDTGEVDALVRRAGEARGEVVSGPDRQPWGYRGTFTDPDGHLWEVVLPT